MRIRFISKLAPYFYNVPKEFLVTPETASTWRAFKLTEPGAAFAIAASGLAFVLPCLKMLYLKLTKQPIPGEANLELHERTSYFKEPRRPEDTYYYEYIYSDGTSEVRKLEEY